MSERARAHAALDAAAASAALHERVRAFARRALGEGAAARGLEPAEGFEALALDIARFQAQHGAALARLCRHHAARLDALDDVPAVPADAFRLTRIAAHPEAEDVARFVTSGTTGGAGRHAFRTLETYRELSVRWGRRALLGGAPRCTALALAPPFEPERRSSLGFMLQQFMLDFDGRGLDGGVFDPRAPARWLLAGGRVDVDGLRRGAALAAERGEPLLLLATSFALVWLLDVLAGAELPLPAGSRVMLTGGFKGRSRSVDERDLAAALCQTFALGPERLVGEYGMTELSSQLYDSGARPGEGQSVFVEPPWLRVTPVDPISLSPVAEGEQGLACFTDLANVDSALRVLTLDRLRRVAGGIVLCGR
ncbi:MAG TPA: acyl-protein synthetase, partial [Polyangiaceae bacterium]|nr:acyl-protein synthetase [Polyangiaceae bacterium]